MTTVILKQKYVAVNRSPKKLSKDISVSRSNQNETGKVVICSRLENLLSTDKLDDEQKWN